METVEGLVAILLLNFVGIVAEFALLLLATVAIHELGHWLAGAMVGYELFMFRVTPFEWWRTDKGFRLKLIPIRSHLGLIVMIPRSFGGLRWRHAVYVLGGPTASILLFVALVVSFSKAGGFGDFRVLDPRQETIARMLGFASMISFGPAAASLFRSVTKEGHLSDGLQLYNLWKNPAQYELSIVGWSIVVPWRHLLRPSRWNPKAIEYLLGHIREDKQLAGIHLAGFYYFLDVGDQEKAMEHIFTAARHALAAGDNLEARTREMVFPEAAYCSALYREDLEGAKGYLSHLERPEMKDYTEYFRAEAAILWKEGETGRAREIVSWAYDKLISDKQLLESGAAEFERALLVEIVEPGSSALAAVPLRSA